MESSIACRDRWSSKAQDIQRCKSGHASSLAVWIESKSASVGGRKIRRGVTIGIKWRIERLRWNCSGVVKTKKGAACLSTALGNCLGADDSNTVQSQCSRVLGGVKSRYSAQNAPTLANKRRKLLKSPDCVNHLGAAQLRYRLLM